MDGNKWVWLTRDGDGQSYDIFAKQSEVPEADFFDDEPRYDGDFTMCAGSFHAATGFELCNGEIAKVRIAVDRLPWELA